MLFRIRVKHYKNKQAKTFGSQVAESAVCAGLQTPGLTCAQVTIQQSPEGEQYEPEYEPFCIVCEKIIFSFLF